MAMTEEQRAQESKQRGVEATKISDPAARRAYIAAQGNAYAYSRGYTAAHGRQEAQQEAVGRAMRSAESSDPVTRAVSSISRAVSRRLSQGRRGKIR